MASSSTMRPPSPSEPAPPPPPATSQPENPPRILSPRCRCALPGSSPSHPPSTSRPHPRRPSKPPNPPTRTQAPAQARPHRCRCRSPNTQSRACLLKLPERAKTSRDVSHGPHTRTSCDLDCTPIRSFPPSISPSTSPSTCQVSQANGVHAHQWIAGIHPLLRQSWKNMQQGQEPPP